MPKGDDTQDLSFGFTPLTYYKQLNSWLFQMRKSLSEQNDATVSMQTYIDNVLLNIMERYPELLEIMNKWLILLKSVSSEYNF